MPSLRKEDFEKKGADADVDNDLQRLLSEDVKC